MSEKTSANSSKSPNPFAFADPQFDPDDFLNFNTAQRQADAKLGNVNPPLQAIAPLRIDPPLMALSVLPAAWANRARTIAVTTTTPAAPTPAAVVTSADFRLLTRLPPPAHTKCARPSPTPLRARDGKAITTLRLAIFAPGTSKEYPATTCNSNGLINKTNVSATSQELCPKQSKPIRPALN